MAASRFQKAVDDSETLGECYRKGLGALSKKERALIEVANTRKLQGSVIMGPTERLTLR